MLFGIELYWWIIFFIGILGLYFFIKLTMPEQYRSIKITRAGLNEEIDIMVNNYKEDMKSIRKKLRAPR